MNDTVQQILQKIAPGLAEAFHMSKLLIGTKAELEQPPWDGKWLQDTVLCLADALTDEAPGVLDQLGANLAAVWTHAGIAPDQGVERLNGFRRLLRTQIQPWLDPNVAWDQWAQLSDLCDRLIASYIRHATEQSAKAQDPWCKPGDLSEVAEHELSRMILQSVDIAVLVIDSRLIIREANESFARLFQVDRQNMIGTHIDLVCQAGDDQRYLQWVIERGESGHYVTEIHNRWVTVSTSPIYHQGSLWGAIAVIRDITHSKKFEEELTRREALAAVGQLAAGMAHEIRNPLTSIKGFIQLLREEVKGEKCQSYLSVIMAEIERIDGLLNDVLVLARYRDDQVKLERFPLMEELHGVVRLLEPEANRLGITLELAGADCDQTWVFGHRARVKQVFLNILKNSLEAVSGIGKQVAVQVLVQDRSVVVVVEDDGPGLSPEVRENLFIPFYTTKKDGTGLGLSTSQRIVEDHGGKILAGNSPELGGARFEVRLPLSLL